MVPLLQRVTFGKRPKSNQKVFAPPLGASLRLGMPALRPSWLTGPADQNQKQIKIKGTQPRWRSTAATGGVALLFCGSGLAREKPESAAFIQNALVIVNDLREQARSHIWTVPALAFDFALQHSSRPVAPGVRVVVVSPIF